MKLYTNLFELLDLYITGESLQTRDLKFYEPAPGASIEGFKKNTSSITLSSTNETEIFSLLPKSIKTKNIIEQGKCPVVRIGLARGLDNSPLIILKLMTNIRKKGPLFIYDGLVTIYDKTEFDTVLRKDLSILNLVLETENTARRITQTITDLVKLHNTDQDSNPKIHVSLLLETLKQQQAVGEKEA